MSWVFDASPSTNGSCAICQTSIDRRPVVFHDTHVLHRCCLLDLYTTRRLTAGECPICHNSFDLIPSLPMTNTPNVWRTMTPAFSTRPKATRR